MNSLNPFSSRRQRLDHTFRCDRLRRDTAHKRIAGDVRSSILELVGEEIAAIPDMRIRCNSDFTTPETVYGKRQTLVLGASIHYGTICLI